MATIAMHFGKVTFSLYKNTPAIKINNVLIAATNGIAFEMFLCFTSHKVPNPPIVAIIEYKKKSPISEPSIFFIFANKGRILPDNIINNIIGVMRKKQSKYINCFGVTNVNKRFLIIMDNIARNPSIITL